MNGPQESLKKALAQDGAFDPARGQELKQQAVAALNAKMRRVGRITFIFLCIDVWVLLFAFYHYVQVSDTKLLILYALVMLACFESTILVKLWYWVMNDKFSVLKELKLLRLEMPRGEAASMLEDTDRPADRLRSLRWAERVFWWGLLVAGCVAVSAVKSHDLPPEWDLSQQGTLTRQACVALAPDGRASVVTDVSCQYEGAVVHTRFTSHAPKSWNVRWTDSFGEPLSATAKPVNDLHRYEVCLNKPVYPGETYSYVSLAECPNAAQRDGDVWTYSSDQTYSYGTNEYIEMVKLPEGAEIVSATPWPVAMFTLAGQPTVRFEATRGRDAPFRYSLQYRLPRNRK
jgi:hypothetical protein